MSDEVYEASNLVEQVAILKREIDAHKSLGLEYRLRLDALEKIVDAPLIVEICTSCQDCEDCGGCDECESPAVH